MKNPNADPEDELHFAVLKTIEEQYNCKAEILNRMKLRGEDELSYVSWDGYVLSAVAYARPAVLMFALSNWWPEEPNRIMLLEKNAHAQTPQQAMQYLLDDSGRHERDRRAFGKART